MKKSSKEEIDNLFEILELRFNQNMNRHPNIKFEEVLNKLLNNSDKLYSLNEMEITGGEPDVVDYDINTKEFIFYDCSIETPIDRRNVCYDREALEKRKAFPPKNDATSLAHNMGVEILDEKEYRYLQSLGQFDLKSSSWLKTPNDIRKLGGAIFGDKRYDVVFIYHNGAESYYSGRGFRCVLKV